MTVLAWIGAQARWVLLVGAGLGLLFPDASAALRPYLPGFIAMVYALAMLRIDLTAMARDLARPSYLARIAAMTLLMLTATPVLAYFAVQIIGLGPAFEKGVVYAFAAPPIASAAGFCLLLGLNARRALELTVACSLIIPLTGPIVASTLLGADLDLSPVTLGLRAAAMIFSGAAAALILRRLIGSARIERNAKSLDGIGALAFLLFIFPLFDGVGTMIAARPAVAAAMLGFVTLIMWGPPLIAARLKGDRPTNDATGMVWGARSIAIYAAALPPDPVFALFVALYQIPMAGLALLYRVMGR